MTGSNKSILLLLLLLLLMLFRIRHVSCYERGGRGVRAVGVATLNVCFRKKAKDKRKKRAVQMLRTGNI